MAVSDGPEVLLLERYDEVAALAEQIRADGVMGLDTEFVGERADQPQLALVQVATRNGIYLIDPLADHIQQAPDQPIWDAMADPSVRTVVHALEQEALFCLERTGRMPGDLFDVQLAAAFCGHHFPIAYSKLVGRELHKGTERSQSRTDWIARPLTEAQRRYASDDVRWLLRLHDRFAKKLNGNERHDRLAWLHEETESRLQGLEQRERERWRRIKGATRLSPRSMAAVRELSHWRSETAQRKNTPPQRVARDNTLMALASVLPRSLVELDSVRWNGPPLRGEDREDVLAAIERALAIPEDELPVREPGPHDSKPARMVVLFLEAVLAAVCTEHEIDTELVVLGGGLRALIGWHKAGRPASEKPHILQGWRGEVCAEALLEALDGKLSLSIANPLAENPLAVAG